jgi:hypothetical protein
VVAGPAGSGRTALADIAVEGGRRRGFEVLRSPGNQEHPKFDAFVALYNECSGGCWRHSGQCVRTLRVLGSDFEPGRVTSAGLAVAAEPDQVARGLAVGSARLGLE